MQGVGPDAPLAFLLKNTIYLHGIKKRGRCLMVSIISANSAPTSQNPRKKKKSSAKKNKNTPSDQSETEENKAFQCQPKEIDETENVASEDFKIVRASYGKTTFQQDMTPILRKGIIFDFTF
jgi:hypothetical protein